MPYPAGEENNRLLRNIKLFITTYTTAHSLTLPAASEVWSVLRLATLKALLLPTHVFWGLKQCCHVPEGFGLQCGSEKQSIYRLATGWAVRGSNPSGDEIFRPSRADWGPPSLLYNGYRVFPGGKVRLGRAADYSPPSSAAVMEE